MVPGPAVLIELALGGAGSAAGAMTTWFAVRRKTSGRIGTSDADILWQQGSAIRDYQEGQIRKLTEQRDRLIDSQANQVLPLVAGMIETLKTLGASVASVLAHEEAEVDRDRQVIELLEASRSTLAVISGRLDETLPVKGTARIIPGAGESAAPPEGQGPAD